MKKLVADAGHAAAFRIESAGTGGWHVGERSDKRARSAAETRGYAMNGRAQQFTAAMFARFDYVLAMDQSNQDHLIRLAPNAEARGKVHLLRDFDDGAPKGSEVPDPYYGGDDGFEEVLDICEAACRGLFERLKRGPGL